MTRRRRRALRLSAFALYLALVPVGAVLRLTTDPLRLRRRPPATNWRPARERPATLDHARRLG